MLCVTTPITEFCCHLHFDCSLTPTTHSTTMRPPRRVPWASKAELAELYDLIFSPAATDETRQAALSRMAVYISSPSCPAFLHLLHTLVGALALPYPAPSAHDAGVLRMTYAMAIVRFVNGMVDPLQTGVCCRTPSFV